MAFDEWLEKLKSESTESKEIAAEGGNIMFGRDPITEVYLLRDDPYWRQKWEELRVKYEQSVGNSEPPKEGE